jgi:hypothetical protein
LLRPSALTVFDWVRALGLGTLLQSLRAPLRPLAAASPDWLLYSLPDALWTYALTAAMGWIWAGRWTGTAWIWLGLGLLIGCGGEALQALGLLPGTADPVDVLLCGLAGALALLRAHRSWP